MNDLSKLNKIRQQEVEAIRESVKQRRRNSSPPAAADYPLADLKARITQALRVCSGRADVPWEIDILDRSQFRADFAVRRTDLL